MPTPAEFVRFVNKVFFQNGNRIAIKDYHWRPLAFMCPFCRVDFDIIGKMDKTMEMDRLAFLYTIGLKMEDVPIEWHCHKGPSTRSDIPAHVRFFSQVPLKDIKELYQNYEIDFKMFGYPQPDFSLYAKNT